MQIVKAGHISLVLIVVLYWLAVVGIYVVRTRLNARRARIGAADHVVLSGELNLVRAAIVLFGPPVAALLFFAALAML